MDDLPTTADAPLAPDFLERATSGIRLRGDDQEKVSGTFSAPEKVPDTFSRAA